MVGVVFTKKKKSFSGRREKWDIEKRFTHLSAERKARDGRKERNVNLSKIFGSRANYISINGRRNVVDASNLFSFRSGEKSGNKKLLAEMPTRSFAPEIDRRTRLVPVVERKTSQRCVRDTIIATPMLERVSMQTHVSYDPRRAFTL